MVVLLPDIRDWFLKKREHLIVFSNADSRIESWFKAELLVLFSRLAAKGHIAKPKREVKIASPKDNKRKQVDFQLALEGENHLCELKALCISQAAGTPRNLRFYFRDDDVGLVKDFKKLDALSNTNKWVLGFIYPSPDLTEWNRAVSSLPTTLNHWRPRTKPQDFPDYLFISLWKG